MRDVPSLSSSPWAEQCRSCLASCCQGNGPFPCLPLPVQTDHGTASELLKNSSSQPANTCSFIILEQAGGRANCFKPGPITKPVSSSSVAWKLTRGPWNLQNGFYVVGVLGELPCPRLRANGFLSQSPSTGASRQRQFREDAAVGMSLARA